MQRPGIKAPSYTTLSLSADDGQNAIVYGPKLKVLYWVETATVNLAETERYEYSDRVGIAPVPAATMAMTTPTPTPTHLFRSDEHGKRELIASLNFHPHHPSYHTVDTITFAGGETYEVDDFFRKKDFPSTYAFFHHVGAAALLQTHLKSHVALSSRLVTMPAGEFKWSSRSGVPKVQ
jgi:hypothetical protein